MLHYVRRGRWRDTAEGRAFSPCFCCGFLFSSFLLEGIQWHIHSPIMLRTDPSLVTTLLQSVLCRNHWQLISSTSCTNIHQLVPWEGISAQKLWTSSGWGKSIFFFCHPMESNHTFPMKSESKLCGQGLSFCVYSSLAYSLSSLKSSLEFSLYHCNHSPLINNNSLNVPCSSELCFCLPVELLLIQLHVQIYQYVCQAI